MTRRQIDLPLFIDNQTVIPDQFNPTTVSNLNQHITAFLSDWYNDQDYIIVHTSGTTGQPKPIKLAKSVLLESAKKTCSFFGLNKRSTLVLCLSPAYIAGKMMIVRAMVCGGKLMSILDISRFDKVIDQPVDFIAMVPMQLRQLLDKNFNFNILNTILLGGSALPGSLESKLNNIKSRIYQSYGMTETASHVAVRCLNGSNRSEYYKSLSGIHFNTNQEQQLIIHAPHILNTPLITNDIVELINKNHFRWLGRRDNVINSGGIKFFPEQIESKLKAHLDTNFYIHWKEDNTLGQKIILILQADSKLKKTELLTLFDKYLDRYEKPRNIIYKEHIQFTTTGKIIRQ